MATLLDIALTLSVILFTAFVVKKLIASPEASPDDLFERETANESSRAASGDEGDSRDIVNLMKRKNKEVAVFYGSQTGTAEDLASKFAKELSAKFGLHTMVADLDDYDYETLDQLPEDKFLVFFTASYGDGEPTDNALNFWQFLVQDEPEFSQGESTLENLHYAVFGLGNNTYEKFNEIGRTLNKRLEQLGAHRVGEYGEGDEGTNSMEEDFLAWMEKFTYSLKQDRGLTEREYVYEPAITVSVKPDLDTSSPTVFLGEPNKKHLGGEISGPFSSNNPYPAEVKVAKELFNSKDRHCIHVDFDISGSGLRYSTGDHLAFWCQNSDEQVDAFLSVFGLSEKRDHVISIRALESTTHIRIPSPTTYETVVRYFLEINGAVSRQVLNNLVSFAPNEEVKNKTKELAGDREKFHTNVTNHFYNLSHLLSKLSDGEVWPVPFSFLIESIPHLQPRYYSISSASGEDRNTISITAVVERSKPAGSDFELKGVATNEIYDLSLALNSSEAGLSYKLDGPRGAYSEDGKYKALISVRHSNFKLPTKKTRPIIMIGPGTGVAPFRAFIHERAVQAKTAEIGKAILFCGNRLQTEDYLYGDEWPNYSSPETEGQIEGEFTASNFLEVKTAFSREGPTKVYVQHRLRENAKLVNDLLLKDAYVYVCGDASSMAREVLHTLTEIISQQREISLDEATKIIQKMKARNVYQEDVW